MKSLPVTKCVECEKKSLCFRQLSEDELRLTNENKVQIRFKKGEIIAKQGSFVTHVMYIKQGIAKVYKETAMDSNLILDIIPEGRLIGLTTLFHSDNIARFSVSALSDTVICSIDRQVIEQLIYKNNNFAKTVISSLNTEALQFYDKMASLTQKQMNGRVADALIYLSENIFGSAQFEMILSRKDLAEFTGMSTMSVVRTLKELRKEGIILDDKGKIDIKNLELLKKISQNG
ncbi:MAG: Crp/Fnr family transcriptional regulator [Bacteroidales bacterium]|jgi:CRP/FNR family transcriptional regulator|nr:Crp/Fnr family transcriptional regulator [Bacteroidales bacterium]